MRGLKLLAGTALVFGLGLTSAGAAEFEIKVMHFLPPQAPAQTLLIEPWAKAVEEQSGGRIDVTIYPAMQLGGKPPQLIDQVRDGVVEVVWTLPSYTAGRFPIKQDQPNQEQDIATIANARPMSWNSRRSMVWSGGKISRRPRVRWWCSSRFCTIKSAAWAAARTTRL